MLVIRGRRVVFPDGERPASIHIDGSIIVSIGGADAAPAGAEIVDCGSLVVSPGVVDSHVHVNEPGRTEWEGFDTATRATMTFNVKCEVVNDYRGADRMASAELRLDPSRRPLLKYAE